MGQTEDANGGEVVPQCRLTRNNGGDTFKDSPCFKLHRRKEFRSWPRLAALFWQSEAGVLHPCRAVLTR